MTNIAAMMMDTGRFLPLDQADRIPDIPQPDDGGHKVPARDVIPEGSDQGR